MHSPLSPITSLRLLPIVLIGGLLVLTGCGSSSNERKVSPGAERAKEEVQTLLKTNAGEQWSQRAMDSGSGNSVVFERGTEDKGGVIRFFAEPLKYGDCTGEYASISMSMSGSVQLKDRLTPLTKGGGTYGYTWSTNELRYWCVKGDASRASLIIRGDAHDSNVREAVEKEFIPMWQKHRE